MSEEAQEPAWSLLADSIAGFTVRTRMANEVVFDFEAFSIAGTTDGRPCWQDADCRFVYDLSEAARYAHGHIKFDGCSNVFFDDCGEQTMLHFCGVEDTRRFGELMAKLYELAAAAIGKDWCGR